LSAPDQQLVQLIAADLGVDASFVEKDWHVVQVVSVLSRLSYGGFIPVFSGGTSLSKAHQLIRRFSEDIDFKVIPPSQWATSGTAFRKACRAYREAVVEALRAAGWVIDSSQIASTDRSRTFFIQLQYETQCAPTSTLRPHVQVQMRFEAPALGYDELTVQSFVSLAQRTAPEVEGIACVSAVETAADKLSALTWRLPVRKRDSSKDDPTVIRHAHDLAALENVAVGSQAFCPLVLQLLNQDAIRGKPPQHIAALPPMGRMSYALQLLRDDPEYRQEYEQFVTAMSYAPADETLSFDEAMAAVSRLAACVIRFAQPR
jgi:hypothetical protein